MVAIVIAAFISMRECKTAHGVYSYSLDVSGLDRASYEWINGESPLPGWQSYAEDEAVTVLKRNSGSATAGGLYLWDTNGLFAAGTLSGSGKARRFGCIFENDTFVEATNITLTTRCAQVRARNTGPDFVYLEYAIAKDIESIAGTGAEWKRLQDATFFSPVISGVLDGELPAYGPVVETSIGQAMAAGDRLAVRWTDFSPPSGGNAAFAYPLFRLDIAADPWFSVKLK